MWPRRLKSRGGRTFLAPNALGGRETTRAGGWSTAHRLGWLADGFWVGGTADSSGLSRRTTGVTPSLLRNAGFAMRAAFLRCRVFVCRPACLGLLCARVRLSCHPSLCCKLLFSCVPAACAHVFSCTSLVLSCNAAFSHSLFAGLRDVCLHAAPGPLGIRVSD